MNISFDGFDTKIITFNTDDDIEAGTPVKITERGKVEAASTDEDFIGMAVSCKNGLAGVCVRGVVEFDCTDDTIQPGYNYIASNGGTEICAGENVMKLVLDVDTDNSKATVLL